MKIKKTNFKDLLIFDSKNYYDNRGYFREILLEKLVNKRFKFKIASVSKKMFLEVYICNQSFLRGNIYLY